MIGCPEDSKKQSWHNKSSVRMVEQSQDSRRHRQTATVERSALPTATRVTDFVHRLNLHPFIQEVTRFEEVNESVVVPSDINTVIIDMIRKINSGTPTRLTSEPSGGRHRRGGAARRGARTPATPFTFHARRACKMNSSTRGREGCRTTNPPHTTLDPRPGVIDRLKQDRSQVLSRR